MKNDLASNREDKIIMMKENKLRRILKEGKGSVSTRIWSPWATMMEAAAATGHFDYLEFVAE